MHWFLLVVIVVHGLIHGMGAAKGFGVADLPQLKKPISRGRGAVWLLAGGLLLLGALLLWLDSPAFWMVGAAAVLVSQVVIVTSWSDAKVGTLANVIVLVSVLYSFASQGPTSARAQYRREVDAALARGPAATGVVREEDLRALPAPVQTYLRVSGVVGQPQVHDFRATWTGRIRGSASESWMPFRADQVTVYEPMPTRLFLMDATMKHLPVDVLHRFVGAPATFRVRLLSAFTVVEASGPEMNRSETVTIFNDTCLLAPARLVDPAISWEPIDDRHVRAHYTRGTETIAAELVFDAEGMLVDFVSDDRLQSTSDGKGFTPLRWRTPVRDYRAFGAHKVMTYGEARWGAEGGAFTYLEIALTSIDYNVH